MSDATEDPEILALVEANRIERERIERLTKAMLCDANREGLELFSLLIEARLLFSAFVGGRPGISGQQVHDFIKRADGILEI